MYLGGPTFESRVGLFLGGVLENTPTPLFEQILNSSPMGVFSRDYGTELYHYPRVSVLPGNVLRSRHHR